MTNTTELTRNVNGKTVPAAGTYVLDKSHSTIAFIARHMMVAKVRGYFEEFSGTIVVAEDHLSSSVEVDIDVASVNTREENRDNHLRSGDFFEIEKYPTMTFRSTRVAEHGDDWSVEGDLTLKGVTKPVTLAVEFNGASPDPYGGVRIGFSATTEIDREDYGVTFNALIEGGGVVVGTKVKIEIEAEAVLKA